MCSGGGSVQRRRGERRVMKRVVRREGLAWETRGTLPQCYSRRLIRRARSTASPIARPNCPLVCLFRTHAVCKHAVAPPSPPRITSSRAILRQQISVLARDRTRRPLSHTEHRPPLVLPLRPLLWHRQPRPALVAADTHERNAQNGGHIHRQYSRPRCDPVASPPDLGRVSTVRICPSETGLLTPCALRS